MAKLYIYIGMVVVLCWINGRLSTKVSLDYYNIVTDTLVHHGLTNITVMSPFQCCAKCTKDMDCRSASYKRDSNVCQLNDMNPRFNDTTMTTTEKEWVTFEAICRAGSVIHAGSCYMIVTEKLNWTDSETYCQTLGGHLTDILNTEDEQVIRSVDILDDKRYWIGLSDVDVVGTYGWASGAPYTYGIAMSDTNSGSAFCVYVRNGMFYHGQCYYLRRSICKHDMYPPSRQNFVDATLILG